MRIRLFLPVLLGLFICTGAVLSDDEPQNLDLATCPISGQAIDEEATGDWHGCTLYFCCPNCPDTFSDSSDDYAAKANFQLVLTGQIDQANCPISGQPCKPEHSTEVDDVTVYFCCENCLAKADAVSGDEQLELLFGADAFENGFLEESE